MKCLELDKNFHSALTYSLCLRAYEGVKTSLRRPAVASGEAAAGVGAGVRGVVWGRSSSLRKKKYWSSLGVLII